MRSEFEEFIDLIEKNLKRCPWAKDQDIESHKGELLSEAKEVIEAIEKKDYQNLKEELGDLIWDTVMMAYLAEKEGHFKSGEIMKSIKEKIKRRKPYILKEGNNISIEEANKIWNKAKEKEKNNI
jgi:uncharacterized protein YabN with tetrapyrrole methylase and pyrophosphatase domain